MIVELTLICHSSYGGVVEFLCDLLGLPVSIGTVHDVLQAATRKASAINHDHDLSDIRVGLHDGIFQGATPVLARDIWTLVHWLRHDVLALAGLAARETGDARRIPGLATPQFLDDEIEASGSLG